ncbi:MAG: GAF domain-containing protein [Anaerolineae bacterium]|nr:GAF domain-containing protein [Anaerolineae bacterium]
MLPQKGLQPEEQIKGLSDFTEIISVLDISEMLEMVVKEVPRLSNGRGASIYLLPSLVPQYDGQLIDGSETGVLAESIQQDFIVLAATTRPDAKQLIGKAFYTPEDGLGGWVFKQGRPLCFRDSSNQKELAGVDPALRWLDRYKGSRYYYEEGSPTPILIVPLLSRMGTIGILKIPATLNSQPFTPTSQAIATIIAQMVSTPLEHNLLMQEQNQKILHLIELGAKEDPQEVFRDVTNSLRSMLDCSACRLYLSQNGGSLVRLMVEDGQVIERDSTDVRAQGQGIIGWVFKTGKPLLIDDLREYRAGRKLDDALLLRISDGLPIEEEDRYLKYEPASGRFPENKPLSFLAVPLKSRAGSVQGVLCAYYLGRENRKNKPFFTYSGLQLARSFASTISLVIQNDRDKRLGKLLVSMGQTWDPTQLFKSVVEHIPELVPGTGCCIYRLQRNKFAMQLQLRASSREGLSGQSEALSHIIYDVGEGKTGFCAMAHLTLVFNHFGAGEVAKQKISLERQRLEEHYKNDLTVSLLDQTGREVGLIQLRNGRKVSRKIRDRFKKLAQNFKIGPELGLPSPKQDAYQQLGSRSSWSFVAVPIKTESGDLYGVITVGRPVAGSPFLSGEISLLESIAGRLAAILHNLDMAEQREQLLMSVAHEINTPLQGILADTENLMYELADNPELRQLSEHNLGQVQRLHLQTETIMAVLTEQTPAREFSIHSIYRPLKVACQLFESEAAAKGCDILGPDSIGSSFPDIEMSLFDLELAFKNLVHNAVKYSYSASPGQSASQRYVKVMGRWANAKHSRYSIQIQNYGAGILPEEIEQDLIFQPYYRGKQSSDRRRTGAGLGLAHARQIIEILHHGAIAVTSEPQAGGAYLTMFTVTLPLKQPQKDTPENI